VALAQTDLKRLVAYTSVNHMGYVVLGVAVAAAASGAGPRALALDGAVLQMVSHGLVTGALFLLVGMIHDRTHTRETGELGGLLGAVPVLGWLFVLGAFASLGLPGLAHFPAEFQIFLGTLAVYPVAVIALAGIAITAGLYLRAIRLALLGKTPERWAGMKDLGAREVLSVVPLLLLTVIVGVAPSLVLDVIHAATGAMLP
jgi:NADH-quinone oxidoreductase subunit M